MEAKSSNDSSLRESFVEGVIGEGSRALSPTKNEYSARGGSEMARVRVSLEGMNRDSSGIVSTAARISAISCLFSTRCAVGLSTLPVPSEVPLAVGSS
jgi:hypothetical protein